MLVGWRMKSRATAFASLFSAASSLLIGGNLFLNSCTARVDRASEQSSEQTYEIGSSGSFAIRNPAGSVRIHGSDAVNMKIAIVKKAWDLEQLNGIASRISAEPNSVSVETSFPAQKTWRFSQRTGSVDYVIILPRTIKISRLEVGNGDVSIDEMRADARVDLVNGGLAAHNCSGNLQLSVANGDLDLVYDKFERSQFAAVARVISGKARTLLPRRTSFHFIGESAHGNVANLFSESEHQNVQKATRVNMSVGSEPWPEISIQSTSGDIEIAAANVN
jgi:hypothetical protein